MNKELTGIYRLTEDILSVSWIIYEVTKDSNDEMMVKIRPAAEMIHKKADKLYAKISEIIKG